MPNDGVNLPKIPTPVPVDSEPEKPEVPSVPEPVLTDPVPTEPEPGKKLKTIEEYQAIKAKNMQKYLASGVACPNCEEELLLSGITYPIFPALKGVFCAKCGWDGKI